MHDPWVEQLLIQVGQGHPTSNAKDVDSRGRKEGGELQIDSDVIGDS